MTVQTKPLKKVTEEALAVLNEKLGAADTMRFLGQFTVGQGDYTQERKQQFDGLSLQEIMAGIKEMRKA